MLLGILVPLCLFLPIDAFHASIPNTKANTRYRQQDDFELNAVDLSFVSELNSGYSYCLDNFYFQTQATTGALCSFLGDAIAQHTERESNSECSYDQRRGMAYFAKGIGGGIIWACWFETADQWSIDLANEILITKLGVSEPSFTLHQSTRTAVSILMEQFLVCPLLYSFWDIPLPSLLRGTPPRQIPTQIQSQLVPLLVANAKVWTPVNMITYTIPLEFRVLFSNLADILWQSINAGITSKEVQGKARVEDMAFVPVLSSTSMRNATDSYAFASIPE